MGRVYTCGVWTVRSGHEDEFVEGWRAFAEWATATFARSGRPTLLRDRDRPNRFMFFGPWESLDAVDEFRGHPGFQERVGRLRELLEGFEALTFDAVVDSG